jgi:hypothetical protein
VARIEEFSAGGNNNTSRTAVLRFDAGAEPIGSMLKWLIISAAVRLVSSSNNGPTNLAGGGGGKGPAKTPSMLSLSNQQNPGDPVPNCCAIF